MEAQENPQDAHNLSTTGKHEALLQETEKDAKHLIQEAEANPEVEVIIGDAKTFGNFWLKVLNDWVLNFASGLAYHLLTAMFPVVIVLLIFAGFLSGNAQNQHELLQQLNAVFPNILGSQDVLGPALNLIRKDAGFLGLLALFLAIFNGSRLFITIENCFDVIYHTPGRPFWRQNLMAILMLLLFVILTPIMLLASSISLGGFLGGLVISWLLFQIIYLIVPNQHISFRNSWLGAVVAALALQIYIALFPFYVRHFLGSYTGNAGFAIILLLFFYYFAVILLLGAEVNAFYAEDIRGTPTDIAGLVHRATHDADQQKLSELMSRKARPRL
jgi:membrane protein